MRTSDPIVLVALLLQLLLPVGLVGLLALRRPRDRVRFALDTAFVTLYLAAIALAGLWLALPRWSAAVYGVLLVAAVAGGARRMVPSGRGTAEAGDGARRRLPWFRFLAVAAAAGVVGLALVGRRPLPGPSVELAAPLAAGSYRVAAGGSNTLLNPHLATLDGERYRPWRGQSYGVDLVGLGPWGSRRSAAPGADLGEFVIFGAEIRAPCGGRVVRAVDGRPDLRSPGQPPRPLEGNHVILACGEHWVVLAHMARGTVAVGVGDAVAVGERLGRVGNSGNSDEPHLHVHVQTPGTPDEPLSGSPRPLTFDGRQPVRNDVLRTRPSKPEDAAPDPWRTEP